MFFLDPGAATRTVFLPAVSPQAGQQYFVSNLSSTQDLNVVDTDGVAIRVLQEGETGVFLSYVGGWRFIADGFTNTDFDAILGSTPNMFAVRGASAWSSRAIEGSDLPNPSTTTLGGVFSLPVASNSVLSGIGNDGTPTRATTTGTGDVVRATAPTIQTSLTVTSVNGFQMLGSASLGIPSINAVGSDANIAVQYSTKGSASHLFATQSGTSLQFQILDTGVTNNRWVTASGSLNGNPGVAAAGGGNIVVDGFVPSRGVSVQNSGDTNDSSSGSGSYRAYNLSYTVPASFMIVGRALRITAHFRITTGGTPPVLDIRLKIGGTVVAHFQPGAVAASATNFQFGLQWIVQSTAAPGASVATETMMLGNSNAPGTITVDSDTAQPVNLATNGTLAITIESQWATAGVGTNQLKLSQFIVEAIG